jgi:hypothetical protein
MLLSMVAAAAVSMAGPLYCSANRQFCVAYRRIDTEPEDRVAYTVSIGERQSDESYVEVRTFVADRYPRIPLISNDGRYLVFTSSLDGDEKVVILRDNGTVLAEPAVTDLVSEHDLAYAPAFSEQWSIRDETLVLSMPATRDDKPDAKRGDIEIDLESGRLLTPMRDIYPTAHVFAHAEDGSIRQEWRAPRCAAGATLGFQSRGLLPVDAQPFYANRLERPLPAIPDLVRKARIEGRAHVEAIVDQTGAVSCVRVSGLPFGADTAVEGVVLGWRFRPFTMKGKAVPAIGSFIIEFRWLENDVWKRIAAEQ